MNGPESRCMHLVGQINWELTVRHFKVSVVYSPTGAFPCFLVASVGVDNAGVYEMLRMKKSYVILFLFYFIAVGFSLKKTIGLVLRDTEESLGKTYLRKRDTLIMDPSNLGILHNAGNFKRPWGKEKGKRRQK